MANYNSCSVMWASPATALHTAEAPPQQECYRQRDEPLFHPVSHLHWSVSQITLLSYPCNLPNQHILQTLRNHPKSYTDLTQTSYTDPLELHCLRETALGTLPTNYWSLSFCFEENCLWNAQCRAREWSFTRDLVQALEKESILHKTQILV